MTQREIKFRAWIQFEKEKSEKDYMLYGPVDFCRGVIIDEGIGVSYPLPAVKLMQYTGLRDKVGKEIYDGDIIQTSGKYTERGVVAFKNDFEPAYAWGWRINWIDNLFQSLHVIIEDGPKVIGNKFEDSNLLKN